MTPALFGRDHPAGVLRSEIVRATDSHGGLVLVTGEAGIGKTTLVTDAAHEARRRGALVVGGSCWDSDSTPGYWPWVQVLRGLRRSATAAEWAAAQEAADGRLGILLGDPANDGKAAGPSTGEADGDNASGASADGAEAFGLYDAVTTALVTVSQSRPLVVVLDDLHSADPASLRLLEFAAQHAWFERLLLIGTYRDVEVEAPGHPLQQLILPLVSRASATLTLTGLGRDEVGALMAVTTGREPAPQLVDEVHRRTGGNPFFVEQTARLWHSGSPVSTIPPGVREAVRQRLSLLPDAVVSLLTAAAVLGREFRRRSWPWCTVPRSPRWSGCWSRRSSPGSSSRAPPGVTPSPTTCCARRCTPPSVTRTPAAVTPPPYGRWTRTAASATRCGPGTSPATPTSPGRSWSATAGSTCCSPPPGTLRGAWPTKRPSATTAGPSRWRRGRRARRSPGCRTGRVRWLPVCRAGRTGRRPGGWRCPTTAGPRSSASTSANSCGTPGRPPRGPAA